MDRFASFVIDHKKPIVWLTIALALIGTVMAFLVPINYNLSDYLPESTESMRAVDTMEDEFGMAVPNARVMIDDVGITEALEYKELLAAAAGVDNVMWLDDVADLSIPIEMLDASMVDQYYKDGHAIFDVTIASGRESEAVDAIYSIIGEGGHASGQAVSTAEMKSMTITEVVNGILILVPLILVVLVLSTTSWIEPILFLLAIGVSVLMNMGSNLFMGEVSFIAFMVAPVLQLAVSLDYAIFLLHAFQRFRETEPDAKSAMRAAMKKSFSSIAASAATTFFGFAALCFMQFQIGMDLGLALVKGIVLSFLCVVVFLPAFTLMAYKLIDKTHHRRFLPTFRNAGKYLAPLRIPVFLIVIALIVPCFLAQSNTQFTYGMGSVEGSQTRASVDARAIEDTFGQAEATVVLVPNNDMARESALVAELEQIPHVTSVLSYTNTVGMTIPVEFLDDAITSQFYSDHYARIVVYADTENEGDEAFGVVEQIRAKSTEYYGDESLSAGYATSLYDMRDVVTVDNQVTNLIAICAIILVLVLTFKSATLPVILLATIESAIFINLAVPYLTGDSLNYLGFLVINTVQLGATVDYAILFTDNYRKNRQVMEVKPALAKTLGDTFFSILVSASILSMTGAVLWLTSSNNIVSVLGLLLCRGTLLSFFLVVTFLPGALRIFDKVIGKTTWRANFFDPRASHKEESS
ncbi:efflux RND transporter permease subunit [Raoultibacter massiliensis]|uniref:MMPL family transporter n=1 Tax=Raoultibacter massiliensis TaxID=1852371 RepID=A0ABV1J8Q3_9ACTN